jgi:hypothetical protein
LVHGLLYCGCLQYRRGVSGFYCIEYQSFCPVVWGNARSLGGGGERRSARREMLKDGRWGKGRRGKIGKRVKKWGKVGKQYLFL